MTDQKEHNRYDREEEPRLYRAFRNGWEAAPEVADRHIQVDDDAEGDAFLRGIFARLIAEDSDDQ